MALPRYRGFSTSNYLVGNRKTFMLTNQELVKQDLLNHMYTIRGERVHNPTFGTRIPLLAFEPLDEHLLRIVREDIQEVIDYDPRVELVAMSVNALPNNNAIVAFIDLRYLELNTTETLKLEFGVGA